MPYKQGLLKIIEKKKLTIDVYLMTIEGNEAKYVSASGQFINIKINDSKEPYLRRPMSIYDYSSTTITFIFKVVGEGTKILSKKEIGESLDCLIGLGNGFKENEYNNILLIGGGLGTPPMYSLAKKLKAKGKTVNCVLGFGSKNDVILENEYKNVCDNVYVASMDGSIGTKGTVIDCIKENNIKFDYYYSCGPEKMLDALVINYPDNGELSFEARMGCGFGACMGCSCKVKTKPYKRICVEGPVLSSKEVIVND
ncbi:MAG: dihydroorotate dehydrogenase electron transfer subunit [Thomasclavelia sp.]|jgi:dihydroorotate dehydrogenase electron transfer subunit|nr:dihydroorotate dehydrogenase electron transfer subunit [Thomasclavelia sp.]